MHRHALALTVAVVCVVLLSVLPRAVTQVTTATSRFAEQRKAILAGCEAERTKLGLTPAQAKKKYPTPEIDFPGTLEVPPNDAQAFEWKGPFRPGTKFLFNSDDVEVVKENLTKTGYSATLRISPTIGPDKIGVTAFNPVSCEQMGGTAMYITGQYEWAMKADNGWQLKMTPRTRGVRGGVNPGWTGDGSEVPYQLEFYRPGETKPFEVLDTTMSRSTRGFNGDLRFNGADPDSTADEIKSTQEQLKEPDIDTETKTSLQARVAELKKRLDEEKACGKQEVECSGFRLSRQSAGTYSLEVTCSSESKVPKLTASGNIKRIGTT